MGKRNKKQGWAAASEGLPQGPMLCDFLFSGDETDPGIWMLCSATPGEAKDYGGTVSFWRPARKLPKALRCQTVIPVRASSAPQIPAFTSLT
jgi:hypothetical protein